MHPRKYRIFIFILVLGVKEGGVGFEIFFLELFSIGDM